MDVLTEESQGVTATSVRPGTGLRDLSEQTDAELVTAHRTGCQDSFASLYRRYHGRLVRHLRRRTGDQGAAEDLAHETFVRAFRHLGGFDATRPLWPWLRTIANNAATDWRRRHARSDVLSGEMELTAPTCRGDSTERIADGAALEAALGKVPERQREALHMCYVQGWRPVEAAPAFGVGRNAFEQLLHRARHNLRRAYIADNPDVGRGLLSVVLPTAAIWLRRGADGFSRLTRTTEGWLHSSTAEMVATTVVAAAVVVSGPVVATPSSSMDSGKVEVHAPAPVGESIGTLPEVDASPTGDRRRSVPVDPTDQAPPLVRPTADPVRSSRPEPVAPPPPIPQTQPQSLLSDSPVVNGLQEGLDELLVGDGDGLLPATDNCGGIDLMALLATLERSDMGSLLGNEDALRQLLCTTGQRD